MTKISPIKLKELRKSVRGHYQAIAEKSGFSYPTVQKVLSGAWDNEKVIEAAIKIRIEEQRKKDKKTREIESRIQ